MNNSSCAIGTLIKGDANPAQAIRKLAREGFECFSIQFWETIGPADISPVIEQAVEAADATGTWISSLSVYGNPLRGDDRGDETLRSFRVLMEQAASMADPGFIVSGFAGRVPGKSIPESIEAWKRVFAPLAEQAEANDIFLAFENCRLGDTWKTGRWNIAINPDAWDLMFEAVPSLSLGLEWEPCHQVEALADPIDQLREWLPRIYHIHGKDARIDHELLHRKGLYGAQKWYTSCLPGFGDSNWASVFRILREGAYQGTVDIEGWNDADWSGEKEIEGQLRALHHLKQSRNRNL